MPELQLSLSNVATLARVRRPVVSVWRTRAASSDLPFPAPVATVAGEERFGADAVVAWLEETGRGNNPDVREDAAAHAFPGGISLREDHVLLEGLTALLCLRTVAGDDLGDLTEGQVRELADLADSNDELLKREIDALGSRVVTLAGYADELADAAFGSAEAFERLIGQRYRHALTSSVQVALAPLVHDLVSRLAAALVGDSGAGTAAWVDPTGVGSDLLISVVTAESTANDSVFLGQDDTPQSRLFRRRLRVHAILAEPLPDALDGVGPATLISQLPLAGRPSMTPAEMFDSIDDLALRLGAVQCAIVVAPASVLIDRLPDRDVHQHRSQVLRLGRVRAMVRLPAGSVIQRPRQALALWVLGPARDPSTTEERRIATVDVSDEPLTRLRIGQVVDDVAATIAGEGLMRAHSYAVARLLPTTSVLASRGALFTPRRAPSRPDVDPAAAAVSVERLRTNVRLSADALADTRVDLGTPRALDTMTVSRARETRLLRIIAGNRQGIDLVSTGAVSVIGVDELIGHSALGERRVDRLTFLGTNDSARLTEPGDVVFCTSPRPAALVDEVGGSAVEYPARALRIDPVRGESLSALAIACDINAQSPGSRALQTWPVRHVPPAQVRPLDSALSAVHRQREATLARLAELDELANTLMRGVACSALSLTAPDLTPDTGRKDD